MFDRSAVDPAFAALLSDPRTALRPPPPGSDLAAYRRRLDQPMAAAAGPAISEVRTAPLNGRDDVVLRVYVPADAADRAILFLHGGGFVVGSLDTHDAMSRTLAVASGCRVVSVGYRLAPETPFPAARDDARAALHQVASDQPVAGLVGDSAGGHLAVDAALHAARSGIPVGTLGLLYPVVDPHLATPSWMEFGEGFLLEREWMRWAWRCYLGDADWSRPDVSLFRAELATLPPTRIVTAAADPLRDEGEALAAVIQAAGGTASATRYAGMIHGFASLPMLTPSADKAITEVGRHVRQHMR